MDYTAVYRKIYSILSEIDLPHEKLHTSSLRITNALSDIYVYTLRQFPEVLEEIMEVVKEYSSSKKFGGHDLDDK